MVPLTKKRRQQIVDQVNDGMRASGVEPFAETLELQRRYVEGEVSVQDLLDWASSLIRTVEPVQDGIASVPKDFH